MGLSNQTNEKKTFLNIVGGKFAKQVPPNTEGAVSRVNKVGKTIWELFYNELKNVTISSIEKAESDFGVSWKITLNDAIDGDFLLDLPYSSRMTNGLTYRLPNIDLSQEVTIKTFTIEDKHYVVIYQNGKKVEAAYSKENPNGLPQMVKVKVKGKDTWDDSAALEFIEKMITETIIPKLSKKTTEKFTVADTTTEDDQLLF